MGIVKAMKIAYNEAKRKNWDCSYFFIDLHASVIKPNYQYGNIPKEFYDNALECLQILTKAKDVKLIMYTCSHPHEIVEYHKLFNDNGVVFDFTNENPEVVTQDNGYGCYDKKPYFNVMIDDKAGFETSEWAEILVFLREKYKYPTRTASIELDNIKCSDGWHDLGGDLGFDHDKIRKIFEYGEYGHIRIEVDENLNIIGGKVIPCGKK